MAASAVVRDAEPLKLPSLLSYHVHGSFREDASSQGAPSAHSPRPPNRKSGLMRQTGQPRSSARASTLVSQGSTKSTRSSRDSREISKNKSLSKGGIKTDEDSEARPAEPVTPSSGQVQSQKKKKPVGIPTAALKVQVFFDIFVNVFFFAFFRYTIQLEVMHIVF